MAPALGAIRRPGLIVCEGGDDERLLVTVLNHLQIQTVWVEYVDGESAFRRYIQQLRTRVGFELLRAFGIVRDADAGGQRKFEHSCALLRDFGYPVPLGPLQIARGMFPSPESDAVGALGVAGIVVLPTDRRSGAIEDLLLQSIAEDPGLQCVDEYLECVAARGIELTGQYRSKARIGAWLASRPDPRRRVRDAISAGVFPLDHPAFDTLRAFLSEFAPDASSEVASTE